MRPVRIEARGVTRSESVHRSAVPWSSALARSVSRSGSRKKVTRNSAFVSGRVDNCRDGGSE